jgi:hypothetical protein
MLPNDLILYIISFLNLDVDYYLGKHGIYSLGFNNKWSHQLGLCSGGYTYMIEPGPWLKNGIVKASNNGKLETVKFLNSKGIINQLCFEKSIKHINVFKFLVDKYPDYIKQNMEKASSLGLTEIVKICMKYNVDSTLSIHNAAKENMIETMWYLYNNTENVFNKNHGLLMGSAKLGNKQLMDFAISNLKNTTNLSFFTNVAMDLFKLRR